MPELNAILNSISAVFLILGFIFIKKKMVQRHKACMISAGVTSTLFLVSYIYYHLHHGATKFPGHGAIRTIYFTILITHTFLAAIQVPLIYNTFRAALRQDIEKHKKWARITWPIWLYVSVTGVLIYFMLYQLKYS